MPHQPAHQPESSPDMDGLTPDEALERLTRLLEGLQDPIEIRIKARGEKRRLRILPAQLAPADPPRKPPATDPTPPPRKAPEPLPTATPADRLSPTEQAIVAVMSERWMPAAEIATASGQSNSSFFRAILANLAERGTIESGHRGYRLPG